MENLETSLPEGLKRKEAVPQPEAEFMPGQQVNVLRSNLEMENDWQVKDVGLDGVIYVINPVKKLSKIVNQDELKSWQELGFYTGQKICLQNPKTKQIEYGWQVNEFGQDVIQVINKKTKKQAVVPIEELKAWNDQQTFLPGHQVFLKTQDAIPEPGWQVQEINEQNNEITIFNSAQNKTKTVDASELTKNFQPNKERYIRKREIKK